MTDLEITFASVSIPANTNVTLTVEEDPDTDGTFENSNSTGLTDGQTSYSLSGFDGSGDVRVTFEPDNTDTVSTATVGEPTDVSVQGLKWSTGTDWNSLTDESAVSHESITNTDHANDGTVVAGPQYDDRHILNTDPVGWWPLHTSGGTAPDLSGNNNDGSVTGTTQVAGLRGLPARDFDGTDDYIKSSSWAADLSTSNALSMFAWVKTSAGDSDWITGTYPTGNDSSGEDKLLGIRNSGHLEFFLRGDQWRQGSVVADGSWHHVGATYDESTLTLYVDGASDASFSVSVAMESTGSWFIGSDDSQNHVVDGTIFGVRVYDRALSASEIQTLYEWGGGA